jgi:hypothetical protein
LLHQSSAQDPACQFVLAFREKGLNVGIRQNDIIGRKDLGFVKFIRGGIIIPTCEGLHRLVERTVRRRFLLRLGRRFLTEFLAYFAIRIRRRPVIVVIIIIRIAGDDIVRRIISIPGIGLVAVPVVTHAVIVRPVTAETDEDISAMIIGPEIADVIPGAPRIVNRVITIGPRDPVEDSAVRIIVMVVAVISAVRDGIVVGTELSIDTAYIRYRCRIG